MKKIVLLLFFGISFLSLLNGQIVKANSSSTDNPKPKTIKQVFVNTGFGFGTHQNQIFSSLPSSGVGGGFQLGYSKMKTNFFRIYLDGRVNIVNQKVDVSSLVVESTLNYAWLKGLHHKKFDRFFVGGDLEVSVLYRKTSDLGNNSNSILYTNTLSAATKVEREIGRKNWTLGGEFSLGLLSWVKNTDGYAFSAPQSFLTDEKFSYDESTLPPYKYGKFMPIGMFHRLKTSISLIKNQHRIQWGGIYDWQMKAYDPYEYGQLVHGTHLVKFYFGFKFGVRKKSIK